MLIATVEDVLRADEAHSWMDDVAKELGCRKIIAINAHTRMVNSGLVYPSGQITPRGHEFIRRTQLGWPVEVVS